MRSVRFLAGSFLALFLVGVIVALPGAALPYWRERYGTEEGASLYFAALLLGLLLGVRLGQQERRHPSFPWPWAWWASPSSAFLSRPPTPGWRSWPSSSAWGRG